MSRVRSDKYVNKAGTGAPLFPEGAVVTGVLTATSFDGTVGNATGLTGSPSITVTDITANGNVSIAGTLTYEDVNNIDSVGLITARRGIDVTGSGIFVSSGVVTATSFSGDGSGLSGVVSGIELKQAGASVGTSLTAVNFIGATLTAGSAGISTVTIASAGLSTEAYSPVGGIVTLDLSNQDHKVTATGITTITVSGGTEGESHTVRIINSGSATVGFSTYFLFPSGSPPVLPTADGAISLLSFTVNRVGAAGTQLLAGASLNFN